MNRRFVVSCVSKLKAGLNTVFFVGLASAAWLAPAHAQTLDGQYEFFLQSKCQNLGFQRDDTATLLPGQAGPNLNAYCSGPVLVGGGGGSTETSGTSGGGAGAALGRGVEQNPTRRQRDCADNKDISAKSTMQCDPANNDVSLFKSASTSAVLSFDYLHQRQEPTQFEGGRRARQLGATLGVDHRFGVLLLGIAARYEKQDGDFDTGGDFQTRGQGVSLYGSWSPSDAMFVDLSVGENRKQLDSRRIVFRQRTIVTALSTQVVLDIPPESASSASDSRATEGELRMGYDFADGRLTIGPRAGLRKQQIELDGFIEQGNTPMTLAFDDQSQSSLRSSLGMQSSLAFTPSGAAVVLQLNLDWLHEFSDDQRAITVRFAEDLRPDPVRFQFLTQPPDRDSFAARLSAIAVFAHGVSGFLSCEGNAGHAYQSEYGGSLGLRMEF